MYRWIKAGRLDQRPRGASWRRGRGARELQLESDLGACFPSMQVNGACNPACQSLRLDAQRRKTRVSAPIFKHANGDKMYIL